MTHIHPRLEVATTPTAKRPSPMLRRLGYLIVADVQLVLLGAINVWPGWESLSFLTRDAGSVVVVINVSLIVSLVVNVSYLAYDPRWWRSLGDLAANLTSLVALVSVWRVFPFQFGDGTLDWALLLRLVVAVAIVGTVVGAVRNVVALLEPAWRD